MRELSDFDEMYQEVIIDHYKNPRNKTKLTNFTNETLSHNPCLLYTSDAADED